MKSVFSTLMIIMAAGWLYAQESPKTEEEPKKATMTDQELIELCIEQKTRLAEVAKKKESWRAWCEKEVPKGWKPISGPEYERAKKRKYTWQ